MTMSFDHSTLTTPAAEAEVDGSLEVAAHRTADDAAGVTSSRSDEGQVTSGEVGAPLNIEQRTTNNEQRTGPAPVTYSPEQLKERNRRRDILDAVHRHLEENPNAPVAAACRAAGVNQATYLRWRAAYKELGEDGLIPGRSTGRKPKFDPALFTAAAQQKLVQLFVKTRSHALALTLFRHDPLCPAELREWIHTAADEGRSRHAIPPSLRQQMHVTPAVHDKFRGPRTYQLNAITTLRGDFETLADGTRRTIEPGDWWVFDDMSVNFPFWFASPFGTSKLAQRHQVDLGRQTLCAMDVASGKWLGVEVVGRPRDAYRAEDILRFCRKLFTDYGLPRRGLRLERGVWKSKRITGYEVTETQAVELQEERAGMAEEEQQRVTGGLQALGLELQYTTSAKGKGEIESGFNFLQRVMEGALG
jgi:hypothetical protein